jgi:hypothetical protein
MKGSANYQAQSCFTFLAGIICGAKEPPTGMTAGARVG